MLKWNDKFSCGVKQFDDDHKELFKLIDVLYQLVKDGEKYDNYDNIIESLEKLKEYAIYHFDAEIDMLRETKYPKLVEHMAEHSKFINYVNNLETRDIEGNQLGVSKEVVRFAIEWISNHILKTDKEYEEFLNSRGIQ